MITKKWLKNNHFTHRRGEWIRVVDTVAGGVTSLVVEEADLDVEPTFGVYLKQHGRLIFLKYTNDEEKVGRLVEALVNL